MATARNAPASDPPAAPEPEGFNEAQLGQIEAMVQKVLGSGKPPPAAPEGPPAVTDEQYDRMTDRQREAHVRDTVVSELERLQREDEAARLREDVDALKNPPPPAVEATPSPWNRMQKFLWGSDPDKP
jgi:hypothetical protein